MASTYVNDLRLEEIGTGEQSGTWGATTNTNLELIAEAFSYGSEAIANASTATITVADGASDEARSFYLKCTGGGQACTVTLAPNTLSKVWMIENTTSYTLTFSQGSGANVAIPAGQVKLIATDGGGSTAVVYDLLTDTNLAGTTVYSALNDGTTTLTSTVAELNILDGVTSTAAELNIIDGDNSASSTTVADADRVVLNDSGTMKQVAVTDLSAYFDDEITAMPNLVTTAATTVGALNSGSITSGFGAIDNGASAITTTGAITGGSVTVDDIGVNGKVITMTGSSGDTAVFTVAANGALSIVTTDAAAAAANIQITADGTAELAGTTVTLDSAGGITLDADGGTVTFADAGSSLGTVTSDGFTGNVVGNVTGNVTGNTSGTAATVTGAAQSNITSLGTLTALTVDDVAVDGKVVTMTGSASDTAVITAGTNGTLSIVTTDAAAAAANITITADGTAELAGTTVTLNSSSNVTIDADGGTITFADAGSSLGAITSSGYSGTAALSTLAVVSDSTSNTNFPVVFNDESNALLDDTGALRYNPSTIYC